MNRLSPLARQRLLSAVAFVGFFALWELVCMAFGVSDLILPRPSQIAAVLIEKMPLLWPHALQTLYTTFLGFALGVLAGIVVGVGIGSSKLAYDVTYPLLSGTAVSRDFVELPSQLYEHWLQQPEVLRAHARHVTTGEPMPDALL